MWEERPEVRFFCPKTDEMGKTATDRKIPGWNAVVDHQIWSSDINHTEVSVLSLASQMSYPAPCSWSSIVGHLQLEHCPRSRSDTAHPPPFALGPDIQLHIYILILVFHPLFFFQTAQKMKTTQWKIHLKSHQMLNFSQWGTRKLRRHRRYVHML